MRGVVVIFLLAAASSADGSVVTWGNHNVQHIYSSSVDSQSPSCEPSPTKFSPSKLIALDPLFWNPSRFKPSPMKLSPIKPFKSPPFKPLPFKPSPLKASSFKHLPFKPLPCTAALKVDGRDNFWVSKLIRGGQRGENDDKRKETGNSESQSNEKQKKWTKKKRERKHEEKKRKKKKREKSKKDVQENGGEQDGVLFVGALCALLFRELLYLIGVLFVLCHKLLAASPLHANSSVICVIVSCCAGLCLAT